MSERIKALYEDGLLSIRRLDFEDKEIEDFLNGKRDLLCAEGVSGYYKIKSKPFSKNDKVYKIMYLYYCEDLYDEPNSIESITFVKKDDLMFLINKSNEHNLKCIFEWIYDG